MARPRYTGGMRNDRRCNAIEPRIVVAGAEWKRRGNGETVPRHKAHRSILNREKTIPQTRRTDVGYHALPRPTHFIGQKIPR